jgi:hypothetical protein
MRNVLLTAIGIAVAWAGTARAQAWVAPPNSLDFDLGYQFVNNEGHYGGSLEGSYEKQSEGLDDSQNHSLRIGAEYSTPLQGLSIGANVTVLRTKFTGDPTYNPHGTQHTCTGMPPNLMCHHDAGGTELTDLNTDIRYQLPVAPAGFAITPLVGATIPLTDYPIIGHAAYGKHLIEGRVGLEIGRTFFDKAYADLLYTYSIVEKLDECVIAPPGSPIAGMCVPGTQDSAKSFGLNHSDARMILGYFIMPQLSVFGAGMWKHVHGGASWGRLQDIRAKVMAMEPLTAEDTTIRFYHDQLAQERMIMLGGGLNYQPIDQIGVQAGVYKAVWGDSIANSLAAGVGLTWTAF